MKHSITVAELSEYGKSLDLSNLTGDAVALVIAYRKAQQEAFVEVALAATKTTVMGIVYHVSEVQRLMRNAEKIGSSLIVLKSDGAKIVAENPSALDFPVAKEAQ